MNKHTKLHLFLSFFIPGFLALCLTKCTLSDQDMVCPDNEGTATVKLALNIPGQARPFTRQLSVEDESAIENLKVLVFKGEGAAEKFAYEAPYKSTDNYKTLTVELKNPGTKARIAVLANYSGALPALNSTIGEFKNALTFSSPVTTAQLPMWGEKNEVTITKEMEVDIALTRATARIDVGLNMKEEGEGRGTVSSGFTLSEVHVYHQNSLGYVAYTELNDTPSVPAGTAQTQTDLTHTVPAGTNILEREIYVAEAVASQLYLIIKGSYEGNECFYRLDFKTDGTGVDLPLLRNHCYLFNITEVHGKGWGTLKDAQDNGPSHVTYSVQAWNESTTDMWYHNGHYFGLSATEVTLDETIGSVASVQYETNVTDFTYKWENETEANQWFSVTHNEADNKFTFTAKTFSIGDVPDCTLLVSYKDWFNYSILVSQKEAPSGDYSIDCNSLVVHGDYYVGEAVDESHYLTLNLTSESHRGGNYRITTHTVNGISYSGEGQIPAHGETFQAKLIASGTPASVGTYDYTLTFENKPGSACTAKVKVWLKGEITYKIYNADDRSIQPVPNDTPLSTTSGSAEFVVTEEGKFKFYADQSRLNTLDDVFYDKKQDFLVNDGQFTYTLKSPYTAQSLIDNPKVELRVEAIEGMEITYGLEPETGLADLLTPAGTRITNRILKTEVLQQDETRDKYETTPAKTAKFIIYNYYNRNESDIVKISFHAASVHQKYLDGDIPGGNTSNKETYAKAFTITDLKSGSVDFSGSDYLTQLTLRRKFTYRGLFGKTDCDMGNANNDENGKTINGTDNNYIDIDNGEKPQHVHHGAGGNKDGYSSIIINYRNIRPNNGTEPLRVDINESFKFIYPIGNAVSLTLEQILDRNTIHHN